MLVHPRKGRSVRPEEPPFSGGHAMIEKAMVVEGTVVVHPDPKPMTVTFRVGQIVIDLKRACGIGALCIHHRDAWLSRSG